MRDDYELTQKCVYNFYAKKREILNKNVMKEIDFSYQTQGLKCG